MTQDNMSNLSETNVTTNQDGTAIWYRDGLRHREQGPAVCRPDGTQEYYRGGLRHRDDGPAVIYPNGTAEWWKDGTFIKVDVVYQSEPSPHKPPPPTNHQSTLRDIYAKIKTASVRQQLSYTFLTARFTSPTKPRLLPARLVTFIQEPDTELTSEHLRQPRSRRALYEQNAEQGEAWAQYNLGLAYETAFAGLPLDYVRAEQYYKLAAEQGCLPALNNYGYICENGFAGAVDLDAATNAYTEAAGAGLPAAQCNLARILLSYDQTPQTIQEAINLYRLAAEQGEALGQYHLGLLYESGASLPVHIRQAYFWFTLTLTTTRDSMLKHMARQHMDGLSKRMAGYQCRAIRRIVSRIQAASVV